MSEIADLVVANHILANQGVLDAYGHISVRSADDPSTFLQSRSRSAWHVRENEIMRFDLTGETVGDDERPAYIERYIHAAIYAARPDVNCVLHAHTEAILPYTITDAPLVAVTHSASDIGTHVPRWDIRTKFGDNTNLLVSNLDQGHDLAEALGDNTMVLMRGHGFASCGPSIVRTVSTAVYLARNARVLFAARQLGATTVIPLSAGEIDACRGGGGSELDPDGPALRRGWDMWSEEAAVLGSRDSAEYAS